MRVKDVAFLLSFAALAAFIGYFVSGFFGPQYGIPVGISAFFFLLGVRLCLAGGDLDILFGSLSVAIGVTILVAAAFGPVAGEAALLVSLIFVVARVLMPGE